MTCECRDCRNPAAWHRPAAIHGCANALCDGCMFRIYHGHPHHRSAWEKIPATPPPETLAPLPPGTLQPTLF
jgi:hypothetical protein